MTTSWSGAENRLELGMLPPPANDFTPAATTIRVSRVRRVGVPTMTVTAGDAAVKDITEENEMSGVTLPVVASAQAATAPLLEALAPLGLGGFDASAAQRRHITQLLEDLRKLQPEASAPARDLDGDWVLLYSDAPDITGLTNAGPLVQLKRVGQSIDQAEGTVANCIEYSPRPWVPASDATDVVQQRVLLNYEVQDDGKSCRLQLRGLELEAKQIAGIDLSAVPPLSLVGLITLPFGDFRCLYNDGDIRVVQTAQGYYSVNRRLDASDGW